jgi:hypothetical protein
MQKFNYLKSLSFAALVLCSSLPQVGAKDTAGVQLQKMPVPEMPAQKIPEAEKLRGVLPQLSQKQIKANCKARKIRAKKAEKAMKKAHFAKCMRSTPTPSNSVSAHAIHAISPNGDTIEIENGAVFSVREWDQSTTSRWAKDSPIRLTCNTWGSYRFEYKIVNDLTGESAQANISLAPFLASPNTRRISKITSNGTVILDDGSFLKVSDKGIIADWMDGATTPGYKGDLVIVGDNDAFVTFGYNHVLFNLNVEKNTSVSAYPVK